MNPLFYGTSWILYFHDYNMNLSVETIILLHHVTSFIIMMTLSIEAHFYRDQLYNHDNIVHWGIFSSSTFNGIWWKLNVGVMKVHAHVFPSSKLLLKIDSENSRLLLFHKTLRTQITAGLVMYCNCLSLYFVCYSA